MRNKKEDERIGSEKYGVEDKITHWVLTSRENGYPYGFFSHDVMEALGTHKTTTCRLLKELVDDTILSRYRADGKWRYKILNYHDPDDYIATRAADNYIILKYAKYMSRDGIAKKEIRALKEMGKNHDLFVSCECGRRIGLRIKLEEIDDTSERCNESDGNHIPADPVLGF